MTNPYLIFAKRIVIFISWLFLIDRGLGYVISELYKHEPQGESSVVNHIVNNCKEDVLIFGSSRASHHYDTKYLSDHLGMSVYNCGRDGINIIYSNAILPVILNQHKPKLILLDVNLNELSWKAGKEGQDILNSILLPYIVDQPQLGKVVKENSEMEYYKAKLSVLYRYNSMLWPIVQHHLGIGEKNINGYLPLTGSNISNQTDSSSSKSVEKIDTTILNKFNSFIQLSVKNHIRIVAFCSPTYQSKIQSNSVQTIKKLLELNHIPFYDHSNHDLFYDKKVFHDIDHLNTLGVAIYDSLVLDDLKLEQIH